ncbi:MAG: hypothetical protein V3S89_15465 [Desulfobacterales bacterium]
MDKNQEIQAAFSLWGKLLEMESILRNRYNDEFLALIRNDVSLLPPETTIDDLIPF